MRPPSPFQQLHWLEGQSFARILLDSASVDLRHLQHHCDHILLTADFLRLP